MPICADCNYWFNCFCMRCRRFEPYDNSYPKIWKTLAQIYLDKK